MEPRVQTELTCCALLLMLGGCATDLKDIGREPHMTPVGNGLHPTVTSMPPVESSRSSREGPFSLWDDRSSDLYRDPRAARPGDVLTVNISINDRASLGNNTDRSKESQVKNTFDALFGIFGFNQSGNYALNVDSQSSTKGQGSIDRSEKIQMSVAAVVTDVLPNGNLLISGSQEMRVNYELRLLEIAGIVRPRDISRDNTISYDKIAEARVSYGGRGRLTEVQQPNLGHQIYDIVKPF
jgi:flagellar L-ring protein precursor FlgH